VRPRDRALERVAVLDSIDLPSLEATAALMQRRDRKFVLEWDTFAKLVERLDNTHRVLEIDGQRTFAYETVYFDSDELTAFRTHVRGHRRRFKVRVRHYADSGTCALEVKLKGRRGETIKHRLPERPDDSELLTEAATSFLDDCLRAAYGQRPPADLRPVLRTHYRRLTLVARDAGERLTCDFDLNYPTDHRFAPALLPEYVIVEGKSAGRRGPADQICRGLGVRPVSCSKYLLGVGLLGLRPVPNDLRRLAGRYFSPPPEAVSHV
jgi:hypothetical protein